MESIHKKRIGRFTYYEHQRLDSYPILLPDNHSLDYESKYILLGGALQLESDVNGIPLEDEIVKVLCLFFNHLFRRLHKNRYIDFLRVKDQYSYLGGLIKEKGDDITIDLRNKDYWDQLDLLEKKILSNLFQERKSILFWKRLDNVVDDFLPTREKYIRPAKKFLKELLLTHLTWDFSLEVVDWVERRVLLNYYRWGIKLPEDKVKECSTKFLHFYQWVEGREEQEPLERLINEMIVNQLENIMFIKRQSDDFDGDSDSDSDD